MKATDLRIRNLVYWENDMYVDRENKIADGIFKVVLIGEKIIKIDIGFEAVQRFEGTPIWSPELKDLKPIPITPELLKRAGFEKSIQTFSEVNKYRIDIIKNTMFVSIWENEKKISWSLHSETGWVSNYSIKYIHQLQNLYFALTQKELEI